MASTLFVVLGLLVALIVVLLIIVALQPADFRVQRSATVGAPPGVVFAVISDLHQWGGWSPWEKHDPDMKRAFSGAESGPGAVYDWNGNNKVGEGRLTIVDSKPGEHVGMKLEFVRPFKCENQVTFKMEPNDAGSKVSWIMDGHNNFMGKAFHMFINMDKMVGKDFEAGLRNLDKLVQAKS